MATTFTWSFKDSLPREFWRRFVLVDWLCSYFRLTRDQVRAAVDAEPDGHIFEKRDFRKAPKQPTHVAYNPDCLRPNEPGGLDVELGPQENILIKRRSSGRCSHVLLTESPTTEDVRETVMPTTEEAPHRRKKSRGQDSNVEPIAFVQPEAFARANAQRKSAASLRYEEGLREEKQRGVQKITQERQKHLDDM
jgi:hypothetical protein